MKKNVKLLCLLITITLSIQVNAQDPSFEWVGQIKGNPSADQGNSIITDEQGNVYTTGYFEGTVDFDPGVDVNNLNVIGSRDIFIQKLDTYGNLLWVKQIGGTGSCLGQSITIDIEGDLYIMGALSGDIDFDNGASVSILSGNADMFILKLSTDGDFLWVKQIGGPGLLVGKSLTTDENGNVYTTGSFLFGNIDFDPGVGISNYSSISENIFIQKLSSDGDLIWVKQIGDSNRPSLGYSIITDEEGIIYLVGSFSGTVDFDSGVGLYNLTSVGESDIFIQKLSSDGNLIWVKQIGGTGGIDEGTSIAIDESGNIYIGGCFSQTADFDPGVGVNNFTSVGDADMFIQKLSNSGDLIWVKQIGGTSSDYLNAITTDEIGNVYIAGSFSETVDFDPGVDSTKLTSGRFPDIFIQGLNSEGNFLWVKQISGASQEYINAITLDGGRNIYTTGYFGGTVDFDPGINTQDLFAPVGTDVFVHKLGQCSNLNATINQTGRVLVANETVGTYQWLDCSTDVVIADRASSKSYSPAESGDFSVVITSFGCIDTSSCHYTEVDCYAYFTTDYDTVQNTFFISIDSTTGNFADQYNWDFGDGTTSDSSAPSHTYLKDSTYNVCLDITTSTGDTCSYCHVIGKDSLGNVYRVSGFSLNVINPYAVTGIKADDNNTNSLTISPNPTNGEAKIIFDQKVKNMSVKVMTLTGQVIFISTDFSGNQVNVDLSDEAPGMYIVEMQENDNIMRAKLIKE